MAKLRGLRYGLLLFQFEAVLVVFEEGAEIGYGVE
jgi:hypothetical protein